ncbi:MAG: NUDIX hydrolase [Pseudomonadota bacterium]
MKDPTEDTVPVRPAATVVAVDRAAALPRVLMGQRGAKAVFMPNRFVFPGGRVDDGDSTAPLARPLQPQVAQALEAGGSAPSARALAAAAVRELWEETGLDLCAPHHPGWAALGQRSVAPDASPLRFFFRAITPPGRPRRFDARFFMVPAEVLGGDVHGLSAAGDELSHLQWLTLEEARALPLPFITRIVLSEVDAVLAAPGSAREIPFFDHSDGRSTMRSLGRVAPLTS